MRSSACSQRVGMFWWYAVSSRAGVLQSSSCEASRMMMDVDTKCIEDVCGSAWTGMCLWYHRDVIAACSPCLTSGLIARRKGLGVFLEQCH